VAIIREIELHEVSIVGKPAQPEARPEPVSVSTADLQAALGEAFAPGMGPVAASA